MLDRSGQALAVAARSPADEQSLLGESEGVEAIELRVADVEVGWLRVRARSATSPGLLRLMSTLIASEVERVRAPELASEEAAALFVAAVLARELGERDEVLAAAREVGLRELERGASVLVAHAHPQAPAQEGWRSRSPHARPPTSSRCSRTPTGSRPSSCGSRTWRSGGCAFVRAAPRAPGCCGS